MSKWTVTYRSQGETGEPTTESVEVDADPKGVTVSGGLVILSSAGGHQARLAVPLDRLILARRNDD